EGGGVLGGAPTEALRPVAGSRTQRPALVPACPGPGEPGAPNRLGHQAVASRVVCGAGEQLRGRRDAQTTVAEDRQERRDRRVVVVVVQTEDVCALPRVVGRAREAGVAAAVPVAPCRIRLLRA